MKKIFFILALILLFSSRHALSQVRASDEPVFRANQLWNFIEPLLGHSLERHNLQKLLAAYQKWPQFSVNEWSQVLSYLRKYGPSQFNSELHLIWVSQSKTDPALQELKVADALIDAGQSLVAYNRIQALQKNQPKLLELKAIEALILAGKTKASLNFLSKFTREENFRSLSEDEKIYSLLLHSWILTLQNEPLLAVAALERARFLLSLRAPGIENFRLAWLMSSLDFLGQNYELVSAQLSPFLDLDSLGPSELFRAQSLSQASLLLSGKDVDIQKVISLIKEPFQLGLQIEVAHVRFGFFMSLLRLSPLSEENLRIAEARLKELTRIESHQSINVLVDRHFLETISKARSKPKK